MKNGDFIELDFVARLESGEIFDVTKEDIAKENKIYNPKVSYKPLKIIIGAGFVIPGLDNALLDMNIGDKKEIIIKSDDGFGQRNPELVKTVPQTVFKDKAIAPGMVVDFGNSKGRIQSIASGRVRIDFNHPLAGKTLKYDVEIKRKIDDEIQQVESVLEFFRLEPKIYLSPGTYDIEAEAPPVIKQRISSLILEYVAGVKRVRFVQTYQKKEEAKQETKIQEPVDEAKPKQKKQKVKERPEEKQVDNETDEFVEMLKTNQPDGQNQAS